MDAVFFFFTRLQSKTIIFLHLSVRKKNEEEEEKWKQKTILGLQCNGAAKFKHIWDTIYIDISM